MLYHLFYPLRDLFFGFNLLGYITVRSAAAALVALLVTLLVGCTSPSPAATSDPARPAHAAEAVSPAGAKETALAVREFPPGESWDEAVQPLIVRISNQAFDNPHRIESRAFGDP